MRTVRVANGNVQGKVKSVLNKQIVEFLSIPYCKPPIKELRFQKPQPCDTFSNEVINKLNFETCPPQLPEGIPNGTKEDEETWSPKERQDEDSMYVNVWCPLDVLSGVKREPVFVWIYGGGFKSGSSSLEIYNGSNLCGRENIIVVSFNYRIGMLGFLSLDNELVKGNLGIWDQVLALKWIHENISVFNGNPENITVAGNSAGGCAASLHLLIEESWQYFNKVMLLSGVSYSDWSFLPKEEITRRSITCVNKLLEKFKFPMKWESTLDLNDKKSIIKFLQGLDFKEFLIDSQVVNGIVQFPWTPCEDGELIKDSPRNLFRQGRFRICPTIFSNILNEGSYFILYEFPQIVVDDRNMIDLKYFNESFKYFPHFPIICGEHEKEKIRKEYKIQGEKLSIGVLDQIITDQHFVGDAITLANDVSRMNEAVYYLSFRKPFQSDSFPSWCGIMHSEEVYDIFGYPSFSQKSAKFVSELGNFIKNGSLSKDMPHYDETSKKIVCVETDCVIGRQLTEDQFNKAMFWERLKGEYQRN